MLVSEWIRGRKKATLKHVIPVLDHCTRSSLRILTRREMFKAGLLGGAGAAGVAALGSVANVASAEPTSQACTSLVPAAVGGPMPWDRNVISLRWLGCSCFELVYRNQVILLDAWYDRPLCRDIGLTPQQVVRADTIFIGHAHFDHIADAVSIAKRTDATVVADQTVGAGVLLSQGLPASQIRSVNGLGGELLQFNGFTVQPILAHHSVFPSSLNSEGESAMQEINDAYLALVNPPFTSADLAASAAVVGRGSFDPRIATQGTIAYLFTFDSGYRMVWVDSAGPITPYLQAAMETLKSTNLAIVGDTGQVFPRFQLPVTLSLVNLFNPELFMPAHHDEFLFSRDGKSLVAFSDMATEPLFLAIRESMPKTKTFSSLYRTAVCININKGEILDHEKV
jgi:L-ascorbate metabolism protein UlaG (beta-lactamase superfamily)